MNVEECLRKIRGKAALTRYVAASAIRNPELPDPAVLAGIDEVCSEIEALAVAVREAVGVDALDIELKPRRPGGCC